MEVAIGSKSGDDQTIGHRSNQSSKLRGEDPPRRREPELPKSTQEPRNLLSLSLLMFRPCACCRLLWEYDRNSIQIFVVWIAPGPVLLRLDGTDQRVTSLLVMVSRMPGG